MNAENEKTTTVLDLELAKRVAVRLEECCRSVDMLEQIVGQSPDEHTKPLFEIVEALNKELLELKLRVEKLESEEVKK